MIRPRDLNKIDLTADEQRIDAAIQRAHNEDHWPCTVAVSLLKWPSQIATAYSLNGWRVRYVEDSRDGDYLEIGKP